MGMVVIVEKIHEFSLHEFSLHEFSLHDQQNPNKPTPDEIKQYRKQRRKMLIPKIFS